MEMKHPIEWANFAETLCNEKGFLKYKVSEDQCALVYCHLTDRLVGDASDFIKEASAKYGVSCDLNWAQIKNCADENMMLYSSLKSHQQEKEQRSLEMKLSIFVVGIAGSGKTTQCRLIKEKYGVVHINVARLMADNIKNAQNARAKEMRRCQNYGQEVPVSLVSEMLVQRLKEDDVVEAGYVLEGYPRTEDEAWALFDAGFDPLTVVLLDIPEEVTRKRVVDIRTDPSTCLKVELSPIASNNESLEIRPQDAGTPLRARMRAFASSVPAFLEVYKSAAFIINGDDSKDNVFNEINKSIQSSTARLEDARL